MDRIERNLERLTDELQELKELIQTLEQYRNGELKLTEENFHKLCNAGMRRSKELGEKLEKVLNIPTLKFNAETSICNYEKYFYSLNINDTFYTVLIPCIDVKHIEICIPANYISIIQTREEEKDNYIKKIEKLNDVINENSLFKCIEFFGVNYKKFFRPLAFFVQYRTKKIFINKLKQIKENLENKVESCTKAIEDFKLKQEAYEKDIETIKSDIIPELLKWTKQVIINKNDGSIKNEYFNR